MFCNRSLLFVLCIAFAVCSCTSKVLLYQGEKKDDSQLSILEIANPIADYSEKVTITSTTDNRLYQPSKDRKTWISRIDGAPASDFLRKGQNLKKIKKYYLQPGNHEVAFMYEGSGKSASPSRMESSGLKYTYTGLEDYQSKLAELLVLNVEVRAGDVWVVETHVSEGKCTIRLGKNGTILSEKTGRLEYAYSTKAFQINFY